MDGKTDQLAWDSLKRTTADMPWPTLKEFAEVVVSEPSIVDKLFELYDHSVESDYEREGSEQFRVPAVLALAAPP